MAKHFDNKRDLIFEMKRNKALNENLMGTVFNAYMLMACCVLYEDFEYDEENIQAFVNGIYKQLDRYRDGTLTVTGMEKELFDKLGVIIEHPKFGKDLINK